MGIGNTTASSAIIAAMTGASVERVTGRGTGVTGEVLARKAAVIKAALDRHQPKAEDALDVLSKVGGFEIGGLAGIMLGAAARRCPVVLDGLIATAAALLAVGLVPAVREYLIAGHRSVEPGHTVALNALGLEPVLDLELRLGEGTGGRWHCRCWRQPAVSSTRWQLLKKPGWRPTIRIRRQRQMPQHDLCIV
jgi:nicotinate-nucleotide--dimethylbenzimidazole phosphoribosyltransferase